LSDRQDLVVSGSAERQLERLPERVAAAVVEFITAVLPEDPARVSKPLTGDLEGFRGSGRGDYRVIFWIDEETRTVVVVRVAHRADAYRPG